MKKIIAMIVIFVTIGISSIGLSETKCYASVCPPHMNFRQYYTLLNVGHSYHMVEIPNAIDEGGHQLYARCDIEYKRMQYTVTCADCGAYIGSYLADHVSHLSVYCEEYGHVDIVPVN